MKFEVVSSPLDEEFDPLAQYFWNVSNGLSPRFGDYDQKENQRRNEALIATVSEITDSISSGDSPVELDLASCANYTAESSVALCTLIDTLIEHESSVQDSWDDEGVDSYEALGALVESSPSGRIFALILARVFDELKLERVTWEDLRTSGNIYLRTIAFYWPKTPVAAKSQLLKAGVIELNAEAEEFVNYSFAHPYMSALSPALAQKPLP